MAPSVVVVISGAIFRYGIGDGGGGAGYGFLISAGVTIAGGTGASTFSIGGSIDGVGYVVGAFGGGESKGDIIVIIDSVADDLGVVRDGVLRLGAAGDVAG